MTFLDRTLPGAITFVYMPDEPAPRMFPYIRKLAENDSLESRAGKKKLPVFRHPPLREGTGWRDRHLGLGPARLRLSPGPRRNGRRDGTTGSTTAGGHGRGAMVIDAPATDARATIWGCFKHGIRVYFYWHGDHWRHNRQKVGEIAFRTFGPTRLPSITAGSPNKPAEEQNSANGDGVLFYPGEEKLHPGKTAASRGLVPRCSLQISGGGCRIIST